MSSIVGGSRELSAKRKVLRVCGRSIRVAQIPTGCNAIANQLLQLFHLGKSLFCGTGPDNVRADSNFKDTTCTRLEGHFLHFVLECCQ